MIVEATRRLVDFHDPDRVSLFDSEARGEAGIDSDLDFLVVVALSLSRIKRIETKPKKPWRSREKFWRKWRVDWLVAERGEREWEEWELGLSIFWELDDLDVCLQEFHRGLDSPPPNRLNA